MIGQMYELMRLIIEGKIFGRRSIGKRQKLSNSLKYKHFQIFFNGTRKILLFH